MDPVVEMVGNALCLDFANTVNRRPDPTRDWLASGAQLQTWLAAVGLDTAASRVASPATLTRLRDFREDVHHVFADLTLGRRPSDAPLRSITAAYAAALPSAVWAIKDDRLFADWSVRQARDLTGKVAGSAMRLLQDGPLDRLGRCPACGWLFLDSSRNGQRRWCSMATCGSRDKSARYFTRSKYREDAGP